jgi:hypothetical protein
LQEDDGADSAKVQDNGIKTMKESPLLVGNSSRYIC